MQNLSINPVNFKSQTLNSNSKPSFKASLYYSSGARDILGRFVRTNDRCVDRGIKEAFKGICADFEAISRHLKGSVKINLDKQNGVSFAYTDKLGKVISEKVNFAAAVTPKQLLNVIESQPPADKATVQLLTEIATI